MSSEDTDLTKEMKARCKTKILQQYGLSDITKLLDIATFLDPRFKHCKEDDHKKKEIEEIVKLAVLHIDDTIPKSEIQVVDDNGPMAKSHSLENF